MSADSKNADESIKENELSDYTLVEKDHTFRTKLPTSMLDRSKYSIWSIVKQCVDKELYKFTLPIIWNEPLSLLQRTSENIKYTDELLDRAASCALKNPYDRIKYIATFIISCTSIQANRLSKPFNPLLGETFEFVSKEKCSRICCEQVSHHPPISAFYSDSLKKINSGKPKWKYYGTVYPHMKLNLLSASVEACPEGIINANTKIYLTIFI
jgi:oxysterol-binding protein-related protein 1/2